MVCPRCQKAMTKTKSLNKQESVNWWECSNGYCNTLLNTWIPQTHQEDFLRSNHEVKGNYGGYGSGKTSTSEQDLLRTILCDGTKISPANESLHLVGANIQRQYEQTFMREIFSDWPLQLMRSYSVQKQMLKMRNGSTVIFQPYDDIDKIRSYNLSSAYILEASECKPDVITQMKTRLRNLSTPHRHIVIESNPDPGWIKYDVLDYTSRLYYAPSKEHIPNPPALPTPKKQDPAIACWITTTYANKYLPNNFIALNSKNKPDWWINKYMRGSFSYSSGQVYPNYTNALEDKEGIITSLALQLNEPSHLLLPHLKRVRRIITCDYGLRDDTVLLYHALLPDLDIILTYKEIVVNNQDPTEIATHYHNAMNFPATSLLLPPLLDGKSIGKRDYYKKTLSAHFEDLGIFFSPAKMDRPARVAALSYLFNKKNKFNTPFYLIAESHCPTLINQLKQLKYPEKRGDEMSLRPLPEDKDDHSVCACEFMAMEIPFDRSIDEITNLNLRKEVKKDEQPRYFNPLSDIPTVTNDFGGGGFDINFQF